MLSRQFLATSFLTAVFAAAPVAAQDIIAARAGLINLADGTVTVNDVEVQQGDRYQVMKEGDTLATEKGRAEILLNIGTFLRLAEDSSFRLDSASLEDVRLTLLTGSAIIETAELGKESSVEVMVEGKKIAVRKRGLYEFQAGEGARVRTYDGELALKGADGQAVKITKDREVNLSEATLVAAKFDEDDTTPLYRWGARRARTLAQASRSSATSYGSYSSYPGSTIVSGMRGTWVYNTLFGYFTYLPLSGYGYSPYNLVIVSPRTVYQPTYSPGVSSGFDMGASRSAAASSVYSGGSSSSSGAMVAAPAVSAPAAAAPNTGGGASAGRRR